MPNEARRGAFIAAGVALALAGVFAVVALTSGGGGGAVARPPSSGTGSPGGAAAPTPQSPSPTPSPTLTATHSPTPSPTPNPGGNGATIEDIYRRMGAALRADAERSVVLHVTAERPGGPSTAWTTWADPRSTAARREYEPLEGQPQVITIVATDGAFTIAGGSSINIDPRECPGADAAVALITDCPNRPFQTYIFEGGSPRAVTDVPTVTVGEGTHEGARVIEVTASRYEQPFRSTPFTETRRLLLDPETYLPVYMEVRQEPGTTEVFRYRAETVATATLPEGFFDPRSLPALREDPLRALRERPSTLAAYWLGTEMDATAETPALTLWRSDRYRSDEGDIATEQLMLEYVRASDVFGQTLLLRLTEYTATEWDRRASMAHLPGDPCWTEEEVSLQGGSLTVYSGYAWPDAVPPASVDECPRDRERDRFLGVFSLGDLRVVLEPWQWPEQSREGVVTLAGMLREWEPGAE